jgi:hypothetical protein
MAIKILCSFLLHPCTHGLSTFSSPITYRTMASCHPEGVNSTHCGGGAVDPDNDSLVAKKRKEACCVG